MLTIWCPFVRYCYIVPRCPMSLPLMVSILRLLHFMTARSLGCGYLLHASLLFLPPSFAHPSPTLSSCSSLFVTASPLGSSSRHAASSSLGFFSRSSSVAVCIGKRPTLKHLHSQLKAEEALLMSDIWVRSNSYYAQTAPRIRSSLIPGQL